MGIAALCFMPNHEAETEHQNETHQRQSQEAYHANEI